MPKWNIERVGTKGEAIEFSSNEAEVPESVVEFLQEVTEDYEEDTELSFVCTGVLDDDGLLLDLHIDLSVASFNQNTAEERERVEKQKSSVNPAELDEYGNPLVAKSNVQTPVADQVLKDNKRAEAAKNEEDKKNSEKDSTKEKAEVIAKSKTDYEKGRKQAPE